MGTDGEKEQTDLQRRIEERRRIGRELRKLRQSPEYQAQEAKKRKLLIAGIIGAGFLLLILLILLIHALVGKKENLSDPTVNLTTTSQTSMITTEPGTVSTSLAVDP